MTGNGPPDGRPQPIEAHPTAVAHAARIGNSRGLHARAAAKFVTVAERFSSRILVEFEDQVVSASSIMGLMMLGAGLGSVLILRAEGDDAESAVCALASLIDAQFGESD